MKGGEEWTGINMVGGEIRVRKSINPKKRFGGSISVWKGGWVEIN